MFGFLTFCKLFSIGFKWLHTSSVIGIHCSNYFEDNLYVTGLIAHLQKGQSQKFVRLALLPKRGDFTEILKNCTKTPIYHHILSDYRVEYADSDSIIKKIAIFEFGPFALKPAK